MGKLLLLLSLFAILHSVCDFNVGMHYEQRDCKCNCTSLTGMELIQCKAYNSEQNLGQKISFSDHEWNLVNTKGIRLDGTPCNVDCIPYYGIYAKNHYCGSYKCVKYGKDQYGRKCEEIIKSSKSVASCYVENRRNYGAFTGGSWGWTHKPFCPSNKQHIMCNAYF